MYKCEYCKKSFKKESTLAVHRCEKKRRHLQQSEKHVQLGFRAYQLFYVIGTNSKKEKTYQDFAESQYYTAFVKYGNYCIDLRIDDVPSLTKWLLTNSIRIDRWTSDREYAKWTKERQKTESVDRAIERSIMFLQEWAAQNNTVWNSYFDIIPENTATFHICNGKISPWVVFASNKAQEMLDRMNPEQIKLIVDYVDIDYWQKLFHKNPDDFNWVQKLLKEANMA